MKISDRQVRRIIREEARRLLESEDFDSEDFNIEDYDDEDGWETGDGGVYLVVQSDDPKAKAASAAYDDFMRALKKLQQFEDLTFIDFENSAGYQKVVYASVAEVAIDMARQHLDTEAYFSGDR